jgi:hypothetical protein
MGSNKENGFVEMMYQTSAKTWTGIYKEDAETSLPAGQAGSA